MVYFPGVKASENALRIVLADDHHFFREGLHRTLETDGITVVGEATDGARATQRVRWSAEKGLWTLDLVASASY